MLLTFVALDFTRLVIGGALNPGGCVGIGAGRQKQRGEKKKRKQRGWESHLRNLMELVFLR